ncbi:hypothetical protein FK529_04645 [Tsukamurella asaccharolytica]|uniref:Uncharacterized protein n=1 Tax=Tsukamurella asaccharolytica TaxID=2592067 RepID=A0A5C5REW9_9ACTN|nr:hypothetical protein [Tsukamurella asaccharolytica]TWS20635.1 hypothetical protein FK529_04645 [Tsukamurella asaccharolytica]
MIAEPKRDAPARNEASDVLHLWLSACATATLCGLPGTPNRPVTGPAGRRKARKYTDCRYLRALEEQLST